MLKDQVALVTGGKSRHRQGRSSPRSPPRGAKVAFVYRGNQAAADALVGEITSAGGEAKAIQGDVADAATAPRVVAEVLEAWGRVDILVNNAGVIRDGLFVRMETSAWDEVIRTNLDGTFHFCKAVADQMVFKQRSGRIINISSVAGTHDQRRAGELLGE